MRIILATALAVSALIVPYLVAAQTGATLTVRHLETEAFPLIAGYLDARDPGGTPVIALQAEDLQAFENGLPQPISQLRAVDTGLHIIVVLNPAEPFSIRDAQAKTRFDYVKEQVLAWARALPSSSGTSLSLITPEGVLTQRASATQWVNALDAIDPSFGGLQVSAQPFTQALELAAQAGGPIGQGTAIWWVTAMPGADIMASAPDWQSVLDERGIPLFVWQVDTRSTFESSSGLALSCLAQGSGGQWFGFSGGEPFPNPEDYFSPFRSAYFFQYSSQLHSSGTHQIQLQMVSEGSAIISQIVSFDLDIRPPNPILVSPPSQINRGPSAEDPQQLTPFSQPIEILVEFPDEFERSIVRTALYVNEIQVAENQAPPFTRFTWGLGEYLVSQQVSLRVEAEDELGLLGSSIEFSVQIRVENPLPWYQTLLARGGPLLAVGGVLFAALALFLVMVLSGRLRPARLGRARRRRPVAQSPRLSDPLVDSPFSADQELPPLDAAASFASPAAQLAPAYLQRLSMQDPSQTAVVIPLFGDDFVIGSQRGCEVRLQERSITAEHARLKRLKDGSYHVADLGSDAGTWVNYAPVSSDGCQVRNDDLLHFGRVAFRFLLNSREEDIE
ncbi:MAG: FHA domain-containing protein [Anaerolineales bacterium]